MLQNLSLTPIFIVFAGTVLVALIALTMRAVIRRDKAMIKSSPDEARDAAAYEQRWRSAA